VRKSLSDGFLDGTGSVAAAASPHESDVRSIPARSRRFRERQLNSTIQMIKKRAFGFRSASTTSASPSSSAAAVFSYAVIQATRKPEESLFSPVHA
jgi:hypothetical protein